ncbi:MAG: hypothetical protein R6W90_14190 [Ignavibacteriaceae bacterium]
MKLFILILFLIGSNIFAQIKEVTSESANKTKILQLKLPDSINDNLNISLKERFLLLNENPGLLDNVKGDDQGAAAKKAEAEINFAKTQNEGFKLGNEVYFFLGAAAVAAVIYFLVPDDEPPGQSKYTFGLPVTPK